MWRFDWHYTPFVSSCTEARRLQTYVKGAIAPRLSDATTQEQFEAVMAALKRYKDDLLKPQPVSPPDPRSPLETPEQVVADLDEFIQHRSDETVLGEDTEATP